jgi:hypothetical protein
MVPSSTLVVFVSRVGSTYLYYRMRRLASISMTKMVYDVRYEVDDA